jgi:hypothetical protein
MGIVDFLSSNPIIKWNAKNKFADADIVFRRILTKQEQPIFYHLSTFR